MANLLKFYVSRTGKRYFIVNGQKVFVEPSVSKKQVLAIYKTLKKNIKPKKRQKTNHPNRATTIVNINNEPKSRRKYNRRRKFVKFNSMINPSLQ